MVLLFRIKFFFRKRKYLLWMFLICVTLANIFILTLSDRKKNVEEKKYQAMKKDDLISYDETQYIVNEINKYTKNDIKINSGINTINLQLEYVGPYIKLLEIFDILNRDGIFWNKIHLETIYSGIVDASCSFSIMYNGNKKSTIKKNNIKFQDITKAFNKTKKNNKYKASLYIKDKKGKEIVTINGIELEKNDALDKDYVLRYVTSEYAILKKKKEKEYIVTSLLH